MMVVFAFKQGFLLHALLLALFFPSSVDCSLLDLSGSFFGNGTDDDSSSSSNSHAFATLWSRMAALEITVREQHQSVIQLNQKVKEQQERVERLENHITKLSSSRSSSNHSRRTLQDEECYLTFSNQNGYPTCTVNHLFAAEKGLTVIGNASFSGGSQDSFQVNATTQFLGNTTFQGQSSIWNGTASFYKNVEFQGINVTVSNQTTTTFEGSTKFENETTFDDTVHFQGQVSFENLTEFSDEVVFVLESDVSFHDAATFYDQVIFEDGANAIFFDTATFYEDVTIDGPRSAGSIGFTVKDRVDVRFQQKSAMYIDTETFFSKNVNIQKRTTSASDIPELFVAGDIIGDSDLILDFGQLKIMGPGGDDGGDSIHVNGTIRTTQNILAGGDIIAGGSVSPAPALDLSVLAGETLTVAVLQATTGVTTASLTATGPIASASTIAGQALTAVTTITAGTDIVSTGGKVSPVDWTGLDVTVQSLAATTTIRAGGDITTEGTFVTIP